MKIGCVFFYGDKGEVRPNYILFYIIISLSQFFLMKKVNRSVQLN